MSTLDKEIDNLKIDEMSELEIDRTVSSYSEEGMAFRKKRREVRYKLYRLRTEAVGGPAAEVDIKFIKQFEADPLFDGWKFFGLTWDVAADDPYRCVHRDKSNTQEWDELVEAKFPRVEPGGKLTYPDINVRKKIEANADGLSKGD